VWQRTCKFPSSILSPTLTFILFLDRCYHQWKLSLALNFQWEQGRQNSVSRDANHPAYETQLLTLHETNSEEVETDYMEDVGNMEDDDDGDLIYNDSYEYQGLAASWRLYAAEQHISAQYRVKAMLERYSSELYALNRPNLQANKDIVAYMENLVDEVRDLEPWNIQWKQ
jgi:hypothetical protein